MRAGACAQKHTKYMKRELREVQPKADAVLREQERKTLTVQPKQMAKNKD